MEVPECDDTVSPRGGTAGSEGVLGGPYEILQNGYPNLHFHQQ